MGAIGDVLSLIQSSQPQCQGLQSHINGSLRCLVPAALLRVHALHARVLDGLDLAGSGPLLYRAGVQFNTWRLFSSFLGESHELSAESQFYL